MEPTHASQILYAMGESAVTLIARGNTAASVQEWTGQVYISLSMLSFFTGIWHIGIPQSGTMLFATDNLQEAERELVRLLESQPEETLCWA